MILVAGTSGVQTSEFDLSQQILIVGAVVLIGLLGFMFINSWKKR